MSHAESGLSVRERMNLRPARGSVGLSAGVPETAITNAVIEPVAEAVNICPNCGVSGDDPCVTPSGRVKDTWHAQRGN